jgi:hypothetical protein
METRMLLCNVTISSMGIVTVDTAKLVDFTIEHALQFINRYLSAEDTAAYSSTDDIIIKLADSGTTHVFIAVP